MGPDCEGIDLSETVMLTRPTLADQVGQAWVPAMFTSQAMP
jgi:hypothetical protein